MRRLSKKVETLVEHVERERKTRNDPAWVPAFDVVVIGSGYGGSVAACRFAEAGYGVCLLERGCEFVPGGFPNSIANLPGELRMHRADGGKVLGNCDGLFDLRAHRGATVLVGNALGGTSQINANVALRADPAVFQDPRWPRELRDAYDPLDGWYTAVEDMLGATPYPGFSVKAEQLERLAEPLTEHIRRRDWVDGDAPPQARFYRPPLAVNYLPEGMNRFEVPQKPCVGCGDCVTGCNHAAKNTLTTNYLPRAAKLGAQLYTGASVLAVEQHGDDENASATIYFCYSDVDWAGAFSEGSLGEKKIHSLPGVYRVKAPIVVLAAGTLGSTEILLRSRQARLLKVSPRLGTGFSGNGDGLGFGFDQDATVNAVGWGADRARYRDPDMPNLSAPGPTIVGVLDVRAGLETRQGVLVEDGIVPGAIAHLTHEMLTTIGTLAQLDGCGMRRGGRGQDPLALCNEALRRTQAYLFMGHDDSAGTMELEGGRVVVRWPGAAARPGAARQDDYLMLTRNALGAVALRNPMVHPLPPEIGDVLSGPALEGNALVVHPLGGCPMGESFDSGVVDQYGALFDGREPRSVSRSIHVWDGSIVPTSLGANPLLTIAALAERAAARLIANRPRAPAETPPPDTRQEENPPPPAFENPRESEVAVRLQETLRGKLCPEGSRTPWPAALRIKMKVLDLLELLEDPAHRIAKVAGSLNIPALDAEADLKIEQGSVTVLVRSTGIQPHRTLWALCTWFMKRGCEEILHALRDRICGKRKALGIIGMAWQVLKLAVHAGERREMHYALNLRRQRDGKCYFLRGTKTVRYACDSNVWDSLRRLKTALYDGPGGALLASGTLELDLVDLSEQDAPQLQGARDLPNALLALASYPLFFLRAILNIHLWDFRAPDYPSRTRREPIESQRPLLVDQVRLPGQEKAIQGERHWLRAQVQACYDVPASTVPTLPIALTRFRAPPGERGVAAHATAVLLLHGFAQSGHAFVAEPLDEDLVRHLLRKGFDVWLLDYRTSTALPSSRTQCSLDDVAQYDIPAAMGHIREVVKSEDRDPRIMAIGHCMGAATLAMSLLSGRLEGLQPAAVVFSQVPPFIIGGEYSQFRRQLAAFLRDGIGIDHFNLAADDGANAWEAVMDRVFATLPPEAACPCRCDPQTATCRRISGIIGPLYRHENLTRIHSQLDRYFGWASISVFNQIAKFFEYERLVSDEGGNCYVSNDSIREHLRLPVLLLHGKQNKVFDVGSTKRTYKQLVRVNGAGYYRKAIFGNYGHFDCMVGDKAHLEVFPSISEFLLEYV
jgi:cholesterol oxidase